MSLRLSLKHHEPIVCLVDISEELQEYFIDVGEVQATHLGDKNDYFEEFGHPIDLISEAMAGAFKADYPGQGINGEDLDTSIEDLERPLLDSEPIGIYRQQLARKKITSPRNLFYKRMVDVINGIVKKDPMVAQARPVHIELYNSIAVFVFASKCSGHHQMDNMRHSNEDADE